MQIVIIKDKDFTQLKDPVCAAIGNFDGVHLGHQKLIKESKKHGYKSAILTLYPHPLVYFNGEKNYPLLTPFCERIRYFSNLNVDYLIILQFNKEISKLSKKQFIKLMKDLNIKSCVCGHDFKFGLDAKGCISDLALQFEFYEMPKYKVNGIRVSSSHIKQLLSEGNVSEAKNFLGRNYIIEGEVIKGSQIATTIGYPTANVSYNPYVLPKSGVYSCKVYYNGRYYSAVANVGCSPTINYQKERRLEVHIIDFDEEIYRERIEVSFLHYLREEIKFQTIEELKVQIAKDIERCKLELK